MTDHHELEPLRLRDFTAEQFELGIQTLVIHAGNAQRAANVLAEHHNIHLTEKTLRNWRRDHPNRYQQACERYATQIEGMLVSRSREVALTAADKALAAMERVDDDTNPDTLVKLANAAKAFAVTSGVGTDKALLLQGKPTQIIGPANLDDILKARKREYSTYVDSTAEELPSAPQLAVTAESETKAA